VGAELGHQVAFYDRDSLRDAASAVGLEPLAVWSGPALLGHFISPNREGVREAYDEFAAWLYTTSTSADGYADVAVRVPGDACEAGGLALQVFDGESTGLDNSSDELACVNLSGELQTLADTFTTCVLEPGYCHCSEEFRFAVEDTDLAPRAIEPWMCIEKLRAAADFCEDPPAQAGPILSVIAADCIEASAEAWDGCDFGTVEGDR